MRRSRLAPSERRMAEFILAGCGTGQLQAGDIGAGDDQHHPDGDHDEQNGELQSAVLLRGRGNGEPGQTSAVAGLLNSE